MNCREIMQALIEGKHVGRNRVDVWLNDAGHIEGRFASVEQLARVFTYASLHKILPPPNPCAQGTFAWARHEARRGYDVARPGLGMVVPATGFEHIRFSMVDIDATDWCHA